MRSICSIPRFPTLRPSLTPELIGIEKKAEQTTAFEFRPLGEGVQNFPEILDAVKDAGSEWVVVEQDSPSMGKTPLESIEMSINYLRGLDR